MDGNRIQSFEIIAINPGGPDFATRSYEPDGTFGDYTARMEGRNWLISGEVQRFSGQFFEDGNTLSGPWDLKTDKGWLPQMKILLSKA